jgi:hypothetical protein
MTKLWITATLFAIFACHAAAESDGREFLGSVQARKQGRYQDAQRDLEAHFDEREIRRAAIEDLLATVANMLESSYRC